MKKYVSTKLHILSGHMLYGLRFGWLPFALIILLVIQSHAFNIWLNIAPEEYIVRRTASAAALGFLLFGPSVLLKEKMKYGYLILVSLMSGLMFIFQFLYYAYSGGFLQPSAFSYIGEGITVIGTAKTLLTYRLLLFAAGPMLVIAAVLLARRGKTAELPLSKKGKFAMTAIILFCVMFGNGYLYLRESMEGGLTHIYEYKRLPNMNRLVSKVGILNFSIGNVIFFALRADTATAAEVDFATAWMEEKHTMPAPGKKFGAARGRNLILIQVESLENAVIGEKIDGREITPNLNMLADEGVYFSNYYAPIGPGTSADAEFTTQNSLFPLPDRVAFIEYAGNAYAALPALLKKHEYRTVALHGDVPSFWNRANMYPSLGYETLFGRKDFTISRKIGAYEVGDEDFFTQTIPKLQTLPQPFMATLITLSSHVPFELPPDLRTFPIPETTTLSAREQEYLQSVHYADRAIGAFIQDLKATRLYDNALIAIFGDHGSFTGIGSALGKTQTAVFSELEQSHVPLILFAPDTNLRGVTDAPASHLDLYPTVANLLGIQPPRTVLGQDVLSTKTPVVVHRNLISGTIKSILTDTLAFQAAQDGVSAHGTCFELPSKKKLPADACRSLYETKEEMVKVSDFIIKGNLIPTLLEKASSTMRW